MCIQFPTDSNFDIPIVSFSRLNSKIKSEGGGGVGGNEGLYSFSKMERP